MPKTQLYTTTTNGIIELEFIYDNPENILLKYKLVQAWKRSDKINIFISDTWLKLFLM